MYRALCAWYQLIESNCEKNQSRWQDCYSGVVESEGRSIRYAKIYESIDLFDTRTISIWCHHQWPGHGKKLEHRWYLITKWPPSASKVQYHELGYERAWEKTPDLWVKHSYWMNISAQRALRVKQTRIKFLKKWGIEVYVMHKVERWRLDKENISSKQLFFALAAEKGFNYQSTL